MLVAVPQHTDEVHREGHEPGSNHPKKPFNWNPDRGDTENYQEDDDRMGRAPYHTAPEADPLARPADRLKKILNLWHEAVIIPASQCSPLRITARTTAKSV